MFPNTTATAVRSSSICEQVYHVYLTFASSRITVVQMRLDRKKVGFVRPMARHAERRQTTVVEAAGAGEIYIVGKDGVTSWRDMARQRRKGDTVYIEYLELLPDTRDVCEVNPSIDLVNALDELRDREVAVVETHTGYSTTNPDQLREMRAVAIRALGAGGRARPTAVARENGKKGGRRNAVFPPGTEEKAHAVWFALKKYPRVQDAAEALPEGWSVARCYKKWPGGRGTLAKPKKRKR